MTGLRARLEAKLRRRVVVPVPLGDPGDAERRLAEALAQAAAARGVAGFEQAAEVLEQEARDAADAVSACTAEVMLVAPPAGDVEAVMAGHLDGSGTPDYEAALPDLLALCAEDEELRDADWWRAQLARPEWSAGEVASLKLAVLHLVANGPEPQVPKG